MIYKLMTTEDNAEIVHSELKEDGTVMVYFEKPDIKDCFHHMKCSIPSYSIKEVLGFSEEETQRYMDVIKANYHLIMESSKRMNDWIQRNTILIEKMSQATSKTHLII